MKMLYSLRIKQKIFLSFCLISLLFVFTAVFSFVTSRNIQKQSAELRNSTYITLQHAQILTTEFKAIGDHFSNAGTFSDAGIIAKSKENADRFAASISELRKIDADRIKDIEEISVPFTAFNNEGRGVSQALIGGDFQSIESGMKRFGEVTSQLKERLDLYKKNTEDLFSSKLVSIEATSRS